MSTSSPWAHETVLAAEPRSASKARSFVIDRLVEHGLPPDLVDDVQLVVSELAANAIAHANTPFTVSVSEEGGCLLLAVEDGSSAGLVRRAPRAMASGGRGLRIVETLSDDWGVRSRAGSKSVWAAFPVGRRGRPR